MLSLSYELTGHKHLSQRSESGLLHKDRLHCKLRDQILSNQTLPRLPGVPRANSLRKDWIEQILRQVPALSLAVLIRVDLSFRVSLDNLKIFSLDECILKRLLARHKGVHSHKSEIALFLLLLGVRMLAVHLDPPHLRGERG